MKEIIDSPFLWSGKKTKLLTQLLPLFPNKCDIFIDLFGGSGSVICNTNYNKSMYNDLYMGDIINAIHKTDYEDIISHCEKRIEEFNLSKFNKDGYYNFKEFILSNINKDIIYNLDLFVLSLFAFNGSLEFNLSGDVTSSFGKRNRLNVMKETLIKFKTGLKNANIITNGIKKYDYKKILDLIHNVNSKDIFIYSDVPYSITRTNGYKSSYNDIEFFEYLDMLNENNIKWGMSNVLEHKSIKNNELIEWSKKYNIHHLSFDYNNLNNSNINEKDKSENNNTDEVYICNYEVTV